jgi:hypothetical protein
MQQLGIYGTPQPQINQKKPSNGGFWKRQFQIQPTTAQKTFDWAFGIILPVICFVFDPIVFKGGFGSDGGMFSSVRPFAYVLCFACIVGMAAWLLFGSKLRWLNGFLAGLFFLGGVVSLCVGIVLFPFSFIGLFVLIGALGFTPLLTAITYLRNALRVFDASKMFLVKSVRNYAFGFGIVFSASLAVAINGEVTHAYQNLEFGDAQAVYAEQTRLRLLTPLVNSDELVRIYQNAPDNPEKQQALADVYKALTGKNIKETSSSFFN